MKKYFILAISVIILIAIALVVIFKPYKTNVTADIAMSTSEISEQGIESDINNEDAPLVNINTAISDASSDTLSYSENQSTDTTPRIDNSNNSEASSVPPTPQTVKITIKEGETLTQIFKKIEQNGVCSFSALMETADTYDYSYYSLIAKRPSNGRCFKLEGYLFPDTYEFYIGEKPQDVIGRFLRNGDNKITDTYRKKATKLGYSMDDILIIASIIQREGSKPSEMSNVAAVIYNRLKAGQKLQMDSTIDYIENNVKPYLSGDINRYNGLYNTYKCPALPAGPISNPGINTIVAALNPSNVSYLYFCHDANANYYYATTYDEHIENLKKAGLN